MKQLVYALGFLTLIVATLSVAWFLPPDSRERGYNLATALNTIGTKSTTTLVSTEADAPRIEYKILQSVDQCVLNQNASQGWTIYSMGAAVPMPLQLVNPSCHTGDFGWGIDWVVLQREVVPATSH